MFQRYPTLLPLSGLIGGILAGGFLAIPREIALTLAGICLILLGVLFFTWKKWQKPHFAFLFVLLGFTLTGWQNEQYSPYHFTKIANEKSIFLAEVLDAPKETKRALRLELEMILNWQDSAQTISGKTFLYIPKTDELRELLPGDVVLFSANLQDVSPPQNPHEFDYQNYVHLHQVFSQGYTQDVKIWPSTVFNTLRIFSKIRNQFFGYIQQMHLEPEEEAVASALLLGYRHLLTDDTQRAFSGAGAMHVLAVSGLHVGILYVITAFLFRIDKKKQHRNKWPKVLFVIVIIWMYAAITGLSPSVSRAAVMFTFIACGNLFLRKPATYQAIIASALLLLLYNPANLFQVGFQLSYFAVFGILYLQPKIYSRMPQSKTWLVRGFWEITAVSLAAQAATFPLSLYYFHQFPVFFLISNLLVIPLAWMLMNYGVFLLAISAVFVPPAWLIWPFKFLLQAMISSVHFVERLPFSVLQKISINRIEMVCITVLVFACAEVFFNTKKRALWLAMSISVGLLGYNLVEFKHQKETRKITFYSIPKENSIELNFGSYGYVLLDKNLRNNDDALLFYMRHNQWAAGLTNPKEYSLDTSFADLKIVKSENIIDVPNQRILLMNEAKDSLKFLLKPSLVVVKHNVFPPKSCPENVRFILENGHSNQSKTAWKTAVPDVYDLAENGALEILNC